MMDHVTYHVPPGTLEDPELEKFMGMLGFQPVKAEESVPAGWKVRWFNYQIHTLLGVRMGETTLHLVEATVDRFTRKKEQDQLVLGHFCVRVGQRAYNAIRLTKYLERDSGSGRIWVEFHNLRVEVRP